MNKFFLLILFLIFLTACQCISDEPVCGANQKTYANKCVAAIVGIDSVRGECTPAPEDSNCGCSARAFK
ncbi:hypothetical protein GF358_01135 [Candidatus Woesearchaeota archaeon]|nr:hypothetical protein [Candidatus Woesearchaeota archaeon]